MLARLLTWSGVYLVLNHWFQKILFISYFNELVSSLFSNGPVNKSRHAVLAVIKGLLRDHFVTNRWINTTHCDR